MPKEIGMTNKQYNWIMRDLLRMNDQVREEAKALEEAQHMEARRRDYTPIQTNLYRDRYQDISQILKAHSLDHNFQLGVQLLALIGEVRLETVQVAYHLFRQNEFEKLDKLCREDPK